MGGMSVKAAIERIVIKERIRKDITKIAELAEDIRKNGLLNPVTVMELGGGEFQLLAGLRRVKAAQSMGLTEIEVNVVSISDAENALSIEISENEQREQFTYSEKMDYARLLEEIEKVKARERMLAGKKNCEPDPVPQGAQGQVGKTRDIVSSKLGMGKTTYDRAKYVAENAPPEVIEQLDKGERTIRGAYEELRAKEKPVPPPVPDDCADAEEDLPEEDSEEETTDSPATETNTPPKPKAASSAPIRTAAVSEEEQMKLLSAKDREAIRKIKEFEALPPEGKIAELQRQLKDMRVRAVAAEAELEALKERYAIAVDHKDSIIESLKRQNAELGDALKAAALLAEQGKQ
jgi:ParB family chromosome partitioning protein